MRSCLWYKVYRAVRDFIRPTLNSKPSVAGEPGSIEGGRRGAHKFLLRNYNDLMPVDGWHRNSSRKGFASEVGIER